MQHIFADPAGFFSPGVRIRRTPAPRRASCAGFYLLGQFVAMLFCQLGHAQSLGEICGGLAAAEGKLKHLGLPAAPARSTLAYANEHRPWQLYQTVFYQLLEKYQQAVISQSGKKKQKFRFKNKLLSLAATVIALCVSGIDWAQFSAHQRGDKAAFVAGP
jgi:hypothetical protein